MMLASARCPPLCATGGNLSGSSSGGGRQQYPGVQPGGVGVPLNLPKAGVTPPRRSELEVVINGINCDLGFAAVNAVHKARGMKISGAIDRQKIGEDIGEIAGLDEPLEIPISNDLSIVLSSISQRRATGVVLDLSGPAGKFDTIKQCLAFGLAAVVPGWNTSPKDIKDLAEFCDKASIGCIIAPDLHVGSVLLRQAAAKAAMYYKEAKVSQVGGEPCGTSPSAEAISFAESISGFGPEFTHTAAATDAREGYASGVYGDGVFVEQQMEAAAPGRTVEIVLGKPHEEIKFTHSASSIDAQMVGLLAALRKAPKLKELVFGLESIL